MKLKLRWSDEMCPLGEFWHSWVIRDPMELLVYGTFMLWVLSMPHARPELN